MPGTPTRSGHGVVPGVVISPSSGGNAPVRLHPLFPEAYHSLHSWHSDPKMALWIADLVPSIYHPLAPQKPCLETLPHPVLDRSQALSIA